MLKNKYMQSEISAILNLFILYDSSGTKKLDHFFTAILVSGYSQGVSLMSGVSVGVPHNYPKVYGSAHAFCAGQKRMVDHAFCPMIKSMLYDNS